MKKSHCALAVFVGGMLCAASQTLHARPLLSEEAQTVGKWSFESGFGLSQRNDTFDSPKINYKTVNLPIKARLGVHRAVDLGFNLTYISQRLETGDAHFSGSRTGLVSPLIKISPWTNAGFLGIWHSKRSEAGDQNLPIARGDDFETIALFTLPSAWPINLNIGYLFRGKYSSKLGVNDGPLYPIVPGDVFEAKTSLEIPIHWHFNLLTELAYYNTQSKKIAGTTIEHSAGDALDALAGFSWSWQGWNAGAGVAFGLLDESHTSFDLERGAGDITYKVAVTYKLTPRKPNQ